MKNIKITIKKELRAIVRDKKSLLMMALTPLFVPLFVILMSYMYEYMMNEEENIYNIGVNYELNSIEKELSTKSNLNITFYNDIDSLNEAYDNGNIDAYIYKENNIYNVYNNSGSEEGSYINMYITNYLDSYNNYLGNNYLLSNNINPDFVYNNITYTLNELEGDSMMASQIINMAIVFSIMAITLSSIYGATDITAGEKERGTLETLLTYPIKSKELVVGKFLAVSISNIITLIISIILCIISLLYVKNNYIIFENITLNINIITIILMFIILVTYSLFISGLCIMIASFAKSFKEAQSMLTPVSLVICVPMFLQLLNIELDSIFILIPILNHSFILNDIFSGTINKLNIFIIIITSIIYAIILLSIIIKQYKSEKILFNTN